MGRRGPKARSDVEKVARGNPGKRPIRKAPANRAASPVQSAVGIARPAWLTEKVAREIWDRLRSGGTAAHFIKATDVNAFGRYCVYMANWIDANKKLTKLGDPVYETASNHGKMLRIHPLHVVRSRLEDDLVKLEGLLGLTPADRIRITQQMAAAAGLPPGGLFDAPGSKAPEAREGGESDSNIMPPPAEDEFPTVGVLGRPH